MPRLIVCPIAPLACLDHPLICLNALARLVVHERPPWIIAPSRRMPLPRIPAMLQAIMPRCVDGGFAPFGYTR